ncbi:MAG: homocysteine S-methyltransferase family protein, partial [Planctomycetes bacterium]|nr:homocysteine S-methyltransferase family protein [Planctomycetota bacterium]
TFSANPSAVVDFQSENLVQELNFEGARIARMVADSADRQVYVAGSMGIFQLLLGQASEMEIEKYLAGYKLQTDALCADGADFIVLETIWHLDLAEIIADAIQEIVRKYGKRLAFSVTVDETWELPTGDTVEDFAKVFSAYNPLFLGINCSNEPKSIVDSALKLAEITKFPILAAPNAGLPDKNGNYPLHPEEFLNHMKPMLESKKIAILGGCCGTTPEHIRLLKNFIKENE